MSSTPGSAKGLTCQKFGWKNLYVSARGYKNLNYSSWCLMIDALQ